MGEFDFRFLVEVLTKSWERTSMNDKMNQTSVCLTFCGRSGHIKETTEGGL